MSNSSNRRGQSLITFLLVFPLLIGALGLTVDLGWSYFRQEAAKSAAQAAALAGTTAAGTLSSGTPTCGTHNVVCQSSTRCPAPIANPAVTNIDVACQYAKDNGFAYSVGGLQNVMVASGTGTPNGMSGLTVPYWVQATAVESITQTFSAVFGSSLGLVSASATSGYLKPSGGCLYVLGSPGTTVSLSGNTTALSIGCNVYINSTSSSAANLQGGASITATGGATVNITGNWVGSGNATISPSPNINSPAVADPLSRLTPPTANGCSASAASGSHTYSPCVAGGVMTITTQVSLSGQNVVTFNPGIYILNNGLQMQGSGTTVNATGGVMLYIQGGGILISGGATFNLAGPTSGAYKGIAIYQPASNATTMQMEGGSTQNIQGAIYVPGANLLFQGGSSSSSGGATIVCKSITIDGGSTIKQPAATAYSGSTGPALLQ